MRQAIVAALLFAPVLAAAPLAYHVPDPPVSPIVSRLPACKSGWKSDALAGNQYIPLQYDFHVTADGPAEGMSIVDTEGRVVAKIGRGQDVAFNCFDLPIRETI